MTRNSFAIAFVLAIIVTIFPVVIHKRSTGRWGGPESTAAAATLESLPDDFADWEDVRSSELPDYALNQLECFGYINRIYMHRPSGQVLSVFVLVGPPAQTAGHTPGHCYSSRDYTIIQKPQKTSIPGAGHGSDEFWTMTFRSRGIDGGLQRVWYAWSDGGRWRADKNPKYNFPGRQYLYKIQVAAHAPANTPFDKENKNEVVRSFLTDFLPVLQNYLDASTT